MGSRRAALRAGSIPKTTPMPTDTVTAMTVNRIGTPASMFISMVTAGRQTADVDEIVQEIRQQLGVVLQR